uniref:IF rod domain-containing protein n=1 Tax=Myripristis murdjan TaxID=586833 RepID=A0A667ZB31_9TELE
MSQRMHDRCDFPHSITQAEYAQHKLNRSGSDTSFVSRRECDMMASKGMNLTSPFSGKLVKMNEKEQLHGLNDRFAGFIEKVRHLEHQNHLLEREIEEIKERAQSSSSLEQEYGPELGKLRKLIEEITHQKHQIQIDHQNLEEELSNLRKRYEKEASSRSLAESNIMVLKKDINDAYQAKLQLDKKAQSLVDEIHFLKKTHQDEVSEMTAQIQDAQVTVKAQEFGNPDLTAALRDIRAQLEGHAVSDLQQAGESFRSQFAKLTETAETKREALKVTQQEIQEYRRRLQAKSIELDCARGTREALEKQLRDVEDRHKQEIIHYQNELINAKFDMSDVILKWLSGETHMSMPYIYRQSPVYTLPCVSRQGGSARRAEPQYKFVEEIITETTREIEMSEFEETGSDETVGGEGEQACVKRDKGSSEEEEGADNKDIPEGEGEQMSDGQQYQVEQDEDAVQGDDGGNAERSGEVEDGREGEESEEAEAGDSKEDTDTDKNTKSEVQIEEVINKEKHGQQDGVAENRKEEGEHVVEKNVDLKESKGTSDKDKESKDSDKTQELSSVVKVQDEALSLAPQTVEKTTDLTSELKSSLPVETEKPSEKKAPETSSTAPKNEEKEDSHTEQKVTSKTGTEKDTTEDKVPKTSQNTHSDHKEKDKELPFDSNVKDIPKVEDKKPDAGDKIKTVESQVPKEKITEAAESKDLQQGAPDKQIQKSESSEGSSKVKVIESGSKQMEDAKSKDSVGVTESQTQGRSEEAEVAKIKTSLQKVQDSSTLILTEKTAGGPTSEVAQQKIENGLTNGAGGVKEETSGLINVEAQAKSGKEMKSET